jgi:hypothetical protein
MWNATHAKIPDDVLRHASNMELRDENIYTHKQSGILTGLLLLLQMYGNCTKDMDR